MDFGDFLRSVEHNEPASEQTKRELLDIVFTKAREAHNMLPYPKMARKWSDDGSRGIVLSDWSPSGRYYDPPAIAEITFYEKNVDGFDKNTTYEFLEGPDGLGLAKYVELEAPQDEETTQAESTAMEFLSEFLSESTDSEDGINRLEAFLDAIPEEQKQRRDEEIAREEQEWQDARALEDELGTSIVFESEALALLGMIRDTNWDESPNR